MEKQEGNVGREIGLVMPREGKAVTHAGAGAGKESIERIVKAVLGHNSQANRLGTITYGARRRSDQAVYNPPSAIVSGRKSSSPRLFLIPLRFRHEDLWMIYFH